MDVIFIYPPFYFPTFIFNLNIRFPPCTWCMGDGLVFKMDFGRLGVGASVGVPGISSNVRFRKSVDWKGSRNRSDGPECKGVVSGGEVLLK